MSGGFSPRWNRRREPPDFPRFIFASEASLLTDLSRWAHNPPVCWDKKKLVYFDLHVKG